MKKTLRIAGLLALGILAFLILAIGSGLIYLHTGSGADELGRFATNELKNSIQGDLRIKDIHVRGFLEICVDGVDLRDPQEHKVLTADRLCVTLSPLKLKSHHVSISQLSLERPWLEIAGIPGTKETTLSRAIAAKKPSQPKEPSGPFEWIIDVAQLSLKNGSVTLRPELGQPANFAVEELQIGDAHAHYAADGAAAALKLSGNLLAPGKAAVAIDLDALVKGEPASGEVTVNSLRAKVGDSGLSLSGSWDLAKNSGELHANDIVATPRDVEAFAHEKYLEGTVRGSAIVKSDGKAAQLELRLDLPRGKVQARATGTLEKDPKWDLQLYVEKVDPGAASSLAPEGEISMRASLHGKGKPSFDKNGIEGELEGVIHVGPARLDRVGELSADLSASIHGRQGVVKAFTGNALGIALQAHGEARYDALKMNLTIDAPNLAQVGKAIGVLTKKQATPIAGAIHVESFVTGTVKRPDAQLHVRAPRFRFGPTLDIDGLAVDGNLHGKLETPDGELVIAARRLTAGAIDLGAPKIAMDLEWPVAHLRIDAGVEGGTLNLAGDAEIDDDKDGLELSNFTLSYPGNSFALVRPASVHFRDEVIVEPVELHGEHGTIRLQAQVRPPPKDRIDASLLLQQFDLAYLPQFAMPKDTGLHGIVDLNAVVQGPRDSPEVDAKLQITGAGAKAAGDLAFNGNVHAHLKEAKLETDGTVESGSLLKLTWKGTAPVSKFTALPDSTPIQFDAHLSPIDLAKLSEQLKNDKLAQQRLKGEVQLNFSATGTLGQPRASISMDAKGLGNARVQAVDVHAGALLEKGRLFVDSQIDVEGIKAVGLSALTPFELTKALRDKKYLSAAPERNVKADVVITSLELDRLVKAGLMPAGSSGEFNLALRLNGTPRSPTLQLTTAGEKVSLGRLHGLNFQGHLDVAEKVKLDFGAQAAGDVVATFAAAAGLSGAEIVELAQHRKDPEAVAALLDRQLSFDLEIPGLAIGRASELTGTTQVAEGRLTGHVKLSGSPARPRVEGHLAISDLEKKQRKLGGATLDIGADQNGAQLKLDVDPPGGGNLLAHASLKADLGARTLLRDGLDPIYSGALEADAKADQLDLQFISGLSQTLRRAAGKLSLDAKVTGTLDSPQATGDLHLKGGLFDIVGQGVYDDVSADATFTPQEVVVDRITGSTGPGTFSVILTGSHKVPDDPDAPDKYEFSGEIHIGDGESVEGRFKPDKTKVKAGAMPIRQAGEQRADLTAELDLFGDYSDGLLHATARIPEARIVVNALPDKKLPSLKPNKDVFIHRAGEKEHLVNEKPREETVSNFRAHAKLEINHLYVKAEDFEFPVESNLSFDYDASNPDADPTADGTIHVPNGSFSALGRRFTIQDAKITETGGDITDPELEIKALFENPQANVTITVSGTAQDPQIDMTSNPPMDQDAIAFFLATGRIQGRATQQGGGIDMQGAATSVLGSLLFGQVRKQLASVLPVDVLTIDTSGGGVSEASVGKYIGDRVYIGYRQRLAPAANENTSEGRIEYEISRSVSAEATVGDRNSDVSVLWTHDF